MLCQLAICLDRDCGNKWLMIGKAITWTILSVIGFGTWWGLSGASYSADCEYDDVGEDVADGDKWELCAGTGATIGVVAFCFMFVSGVFGIINGFL